MAVTLTELSARRPKGKRGGKPVDPNDPKTYRKGSCPVCGASRCHQKRHPVAKNEMRKPVSSLNPVDGVECPSCGLCFQVVELDVEDGMLVSDSVFEFVPTYCPMCGGDLLEVGR